jgi:hypothetical protein
MLGMLLLVGLLAAELQNLGMGDQVAGVFAGIAAALVLCDGTLLAMLLIRPQRRQWLIH